LAFASTRRPESDWMIRAGQSISLFSRENPSRIQRVENGARIDDELLKN
jgi:hypothetical protein